MVVTSGDTRATLVRIKVAISPQCCKIANSLNCAWDGQLGGHQGYLGGPISDFRRYKNLRKMHIVPKIHSPLDGWHQWLLVMYNYCLTCEDSNARDPSLFI